MTGEIRSGLSRYGSGKFHYVLHCSIAALGKEASLKGARREVHLPYAITLDQVVAVEVHHLIPGSHEVTHELLLRVVTCVDLRQRPELRVRAEHEVGGCGSPFEIARGPITTLVQVFSRGRGSPGSVHA